MTKFLQMPSWIG